MELNQPAAIQQLAKLHPSMPISTRFCVVGAGPSGLVAAYALVKLGYENVTVLEKHHSVGGMCESVEIDGWTYDLGGQVIAKDSAPTITALAGELEVEMVDMNEHKLAFLDCNDKSYEVMDVAKDYMSMLPLTFELQAKVQNTQKLGIHGIGTLAPELSEEYLQKQSLRKEFPRAVGTGYTASGYGFPQDMPYTYLHEFTRSSILGNMRRMKNGFASLWQKLAEKLPCVRCNTEVLRIDRNNGVIHVQVKDRNSGERLNENLDFDKLIISGALPYLGKNRTYKSSSMPNNENTSPGLIMKYSAEEDALFSKVHIIEYYTTVLKISNLDLPVGFYYCKKYVEDPSTLGHPVAIQRFHSSTNVYLFWSYGNSDIDPNRVTHLLYEDVRSMGGKVEELVLQRKWNYFPHVTADDIKAGFYDRIETLQGQNGTLYVGGLLAFELTERVAAYSIALISRQFGSEEETRYVKKLFEMPLQGEKEELYHVAELHELPGVEFPDLPNLDAYLRFWARHEVVSNRVLYTWLNEAGRETDKRTYAELDAAASMAAYRLLSSNTVAPGDRVLLIYPPGLHFIDAFFGCLRAKVLPVPLMPPDPTKRPGQALAKVEAVAKISDAKAILSTSSFHSSVVVCSIRNSFSRRPSTPRWPNLPWYHTDSWTQVTAKHRETLSNLWSWMFQKDQSNLSCVLDGTKQCSPPQTASTYGLPVLDIEKKLDLETPSPEDLCFLQFTSGSTGDSKGVMITHGGLVHNIKLMRSRYKSTSQTVLVSWLPQYHDMGLIGGLFTSMVSGGSAILFSPLTFISKPMLWLEAMTRYRATHSAAPNFAFEIIVRRYNKEKSLGKGTIYDLSSLRFLMVSAEPVRHKTIKTFVELLAPSGMKEQTIAPAYGLAENCVFVCCAWGYGKPVMVDFEGRVCCGYIQADDINLDIRIVNPETRNEVDDGYEGEIWISSPSSGVGYWKDVEKGEETFNNALNNSSSQTRDKRYIRTGDLGRVIESNLFVTGRIKDLIIVQGRNIYPADIEKTVENCSEESLRPGCCAVFGVPQSTLESMGISCSYSSDPVGIVVVAEVRDKKSVDSELLDRIKITVAIEHGVEVAYVSLIEPRTLLKTTSGKIRRFDCLKQFSEGKLSTIRVPPSVISCPTSPVGMVSGIARTDLVWQRAKSFGGYGSTKMPSEPVLSLTRKEDITTFLVSLVSERSGIPAAEICISKSFSTYGMDSLAVVWAAQKISSHLGVHVAAIDIYTTDCISELVAVIERIVKRSRRGDCTPSSQVDEPTPTSLKPGTTLQLRERGEIQNFLVGLVAEKTGINANDISPNESLTTYGINSIDVVWAAQKLSEFLKGNVAAIDIYSCSSISELVTFCEGIVESNCRDSGCQTLETTGETRWRTTQTSVEEKLESQIISGLDLKSMQEPSVSRRVTITLLQFLGIVYAAALLLLPATGICMPLVMAVPRDTFVSLTLAVFLIPIAWIMYIGLTGISIALLGIPFLQPNYALKPAISIWSLDFVRWWTLYRLQDFASNTLAAHLKGTKYLTWWYQTLGSSIGKGVTIDTTDITDPAMLSIGDNVVLADGATLQSHDVKGGVVRFQAIRLGNNSWVGPYSLIQKGTILEAGAETTALGRTDMAHIVPRRPTGRQEPLEMSQEGKPVSPIFLSLFQLAGLYLSAFISTISAVAAYCAFLWLGNVLLPTTRDSIFNEAFRTSRAGFILFPMATTFPWPVAGIAVLASFEDLKFFFDILIQIVMDGKVIGLASCLGGTYVIYGVILSLITCLLKWCLTGKQNGTHKEVRLNSICGLRVWLVHRLLASAHFKFTMFLSGTEALCMYLRSLGSKVGFMASIRGINPILDPDLLHLGDHCHLGDFSRIVTSMFNRRGALFAGRVTIGARSVVGAQGLVLPGSTLENRVLLGAMSVAPIGCVLQGGGVYVGIEKPVKIYHESQLRKMPSCSQSLRSAHADVIAKMQPAYQRMVALLAGHIAKSTIKANARYFHRIGISGRGTMKILNNLAGIPEHDIFFPGKVFKVVLRHSNSLSSDDDARGDARGAALRILRSSNGDDLEDALIDLTLKSGKAFYARSLSDFVSWFLGSAEQREEAVKRSPHLRAAVWGSLRRPNSYTELHYYSNTCLLFRPTGSSSSSSSGKDQFVKFRLRPIDPRFGEDEGKVEPQGTLPPETGTLPRNPEDKRPPLFLADDFRKRLVSFEGVKYVLQLQLRPVSDSYSENEEALDSTRPWNEEEQPFKDVALIHLNEVLGSDVEERLRFDPLHKTHSLDTVYATSATESASVESGRAIVYGVAQHLRNRIPLQTEWRKLLDMANLNERTMVDGSNLTHGCPVLGGSIPSSAQSLQEPLLAADTKYELHNSKPAAACKGMEKEPPDAGNQFLKLLLIRGAQPLLQAVVPILLLTLSLYPSLLLLSCIGIRWGKEHMIAVLPAGYVMSGFCFCLLSILCRWVLVAPSCSSTISDGSELWGFRTLCDTTWQAVNALACSYFLDMIKGSMFCVWYLKALGMRVISSSPKSSASFFFSSSWVYMDTLHVLNPDWVQIGGGSCVGRNALVFSHVYEGQEVMFKWNAIGRECYVGPRAVLLPGMRMKEGSELEGLRLGMKDETISSHGMHQGNNIVYTKL